MIPSFIATKLISDHNSDTSNIQTLTNSRTLQRNFSMQSQGAKSSKNRMYVEKFDDVR